MSDASQSAVCAVCGQALSAGSLQCSACGTSGPWQDLLAAFDFALGCFAQWTKEHTIGDWAGNAIAKECAEQREQLIRMAKAGQPLPADAPLMPLEQCWNCQAKASVSQDRCAHCGMPIHSPAARELRYYIYLCYQIKRHCDGGRLPLVQAHSCMSEAKARQSALRNRLGREQVVVAQAVPNEEASKPTARQSREPQSSASVASFAAKVSVPAKPPRRPLLEIILDPRTIQWLLGLGGTLLVVGLVVWLAAKGIFDNAWVVAVALGIANGVVLAGGWAMIRFTRYRTAGRAITLLACLVMPLNLWFYHANGLVTLDHHLWVAALVCCALYLASALTLRDHWFVYVLNGGIAMTGLLMLADAGRFWEIAAPAAMLVGLGLLSIHVERAFPEVDGPFGRRLFGAAFFRSGHALLAAGLLMVLGAQVAGDWLYEPLFHSMFPKFDTQPFIVTAHWGQLLALALILAGAYAYFYSDIIVRRVGLYVYLAVFTLLWAEMFIIELMVASNIAAEAAIIALALTALAANLGEPMLRGWQKPHEPGAAPDGFAVAAVSLVRAGLPLGLFLSTVPVLLGLMLHLRATYEPLNNLWHLPDGGSYAVTWYYVVAMFVTAISCRVGAHLHRRSVAWLSATYFFGTAAATLLGVTGLLSMCGIREWDKLAPLVMIVPILYIIASRLYRGHTQEQPLALVAHAATAVLVVSVLAAAMNLTPAHVNKSASGEAFNLLVTGSTLNLLLAVFFAEATLFYGLAAAFHRQGFNIYLATAAASGAIWQLLSFWSLPAESYTLIFAGLGLALLVCYRLAALEWTGLAQPAFQCANALMSLSFVAAALITLSRLASAGHDIPLYFIFLLLGLTALSLLAAWLVKLPAHRRWYLVVAIAEAALAFIVLNFHSNLSVWDKLEIFSVLVGFALLTIGHIGWHREQNSETENDLVRFSLLFGSLLAGLPLMIAVLVHRCQPLPEFSTLNELGMLLVGLLLLMTGFVFQLRSTTITGAVLIVTYLLTLVLFINVLKNVQTAAIWMAIGGAVIFSTGILLSIYRDRLLTLPEKVRRREGIFRVLGWR